MLSCLVQLWTLNAESSMARCQHDTFFKHFSPRVCIFLSSWMSPMVHDYHLTDYVENSQWGTVWFGKSGLLKHFGLFFVQQVFTFSIPNQLWDCLNDYISPLSIVFSLKSCWSHSFLEFWYWILWSIMPMAPRGVRFWRQTSKSFALDMCYLLIERYLAFLDLSATHIESFPSHWISDLKTDRTLSQSGCVRSFSFFTYVDRCIWIQLPYKPGKWDRVNIKPS